MDFKQFLINKIILFFMLTTLITIAIFLIGSAYDGDARFGYEAFLSPLIYAGACVIPTLVTYSRRELRLKEFLLRLVIEFLLIEVVVLAIAYGSPTVDTGRVEIVLALAASVLVIYVMVCVFAWLKASVEARKLNEDLIRYQGLQKKRSSRDDGVK